MIRFDLVREVVKKAVELEIVADSLTEEEREEALRLLGNVVQNVFTVE